MNNELLKYLDALLVTMGQLQFAKGNFDEKKAEDFGAALVGFLHTHGMELRRRLSTSDADVLTPAVPAAPVTRPDGAMQCQDCGGWNKPGCLPCCEAARPDVVDEAMLDRALKAYFAFYDEHDGGTGADGHAMRAALTAAIADASPIPMVLLCPVCNTQHIDAPDEDKAWTNPPHRSHLCHKCGCVCRPADVPTTGVEKIVTRSPSDTWHPDSNKETELAYCQRQMKAVWKFLSPNDSNDMEWADEVIIAIQNRVPTVDEAMVNRALEAYARDPSMRTALTAALQAEPITMRNMGDSEQTFVSDAENSCPHCGGSGHRGDVPSIQPDFWLDEEHGAPNVVTHSQKLTGSAMDGPYDTHTVPLYRALPSLNIEDLFVKCYMALANAVRDAGFYINNENNRMWLSPRPGSPFATAREDSARLDFIDICNDKHKIQWCIGQEPAGNLGVMPIATFGSSPSSVRTSIDAAKRLWKNRSNDNG